VNAPMLFDDEKTLRSWHVQIGVTRRRLMPANALERAVCVAFAAVLLHITFQRQLQGGRNGFYGIDAPHVCAALCVGGGVLIVVSRIVRNALARWPFFIVGTLLLAATCAQLYGSLIGKFIVADEVIASLDLDGTEHILDVGCGTGLLALSAARALLSARAASARGSGQLSLPPPPPVACIDLWAARDQSGNGMQALLQNAEAEGVAREALEVVTGDARTMPKEWTRRFDVVLSSLTVHNIREGDFSESGRAERAKAMAEVARVLRPGGRVIIWDICPGVPTFNEVDATGSPGCAVLEYPHALAASGVAEAMNLSGPRAVMGPSYIVSSRKQKRALWR
jgi:arsenite methyltransferase